MYILFYLFIAATTIQLFYWLVIFAPFAFTRKKNISTVTAQQQPVSIIICAKNEAANLKKYLPFVFSQKYTQFEVIIVDDNSSDETASLIKNLQQEYSNLKYVYLAPSEKCLPGKRSALLKGIETASFEWIVLTDADCRPQSNGWLRYITRPLYEGKALSIGFSPYKYEFGLLNALIRYETFYTALQYFSFANIGMPYMAVGRNMAYTKSFFKKSQKFYSEKNTLSGDDDLLVNELVNQNNFGLVWNFNAQVISVPKKTYTSWIQQKIRHLSTGYQYQKKHKVFLGLLHSASLISGVLALFFLWLNVDIELFFIMLVLKIMVLFIVSYKALTLFAQRGLLFWVLVFDFLFPMILFTLASTSIFYKHKIAWKKN